MALARTTRLSAAANMVTRPRRACHSSGRALLRSIRLSRAPTPSSRIASQGNTRCVAWPMARHRRRQRRVVPMPPGTAFCAVLGPHARHGEEASLASRLYLRFGRCGRTRVGNVGFYKMARGPFDVQFPVHFRDKVGLWWELITTGTKLSINPYPNSKTPQLPVV